jgi:hypothetical protein
VIGELGSRHFNLISKAAFYRLPPLSGEHFALGTVRRLVRSSLEALAGRIIDHPINRCDDGLALRICRGRLANLAG